MCKYSNFDPKFFIDIGFGHKKPDKIRTIVGKITAIGFITAVEMEALRADASDFDAPRLFPQQRRQRRSRRIFRNDL